MGLFSFSSGFRRTGVDREFAYQTPWKHTRRENIVLAPVHSRKQPFLCKRGHKYVQQRGRIIHAPGDMGCFAYAESSRKCLRRIFVEIFPFR